MFNTYWYLLFVGNQYFAKIDTGLQNGVNIANIWKEQLQ